MGTRGAAALVLACVATACGGADAGGAGGASSASASTAASGAGGAGGAAASSCDVVVLDNATLPEVTIAGDVGSTLGIGDPSIAYAAGAARGILTYTTTAFDAQGSLPLHTRVAATTDAGATFTFLTEANVPSAVTVQTTDGTLCGGAPPCSRTGMLVHETSSIVEDPADPDPSRRFKLWMHSYFELPPETSGGSPQFRWWDGYVGMQTAPAPEGPWSSETKLIGWLSDADVSSSGAAILISQIPGMPMCTFVGEPGAVATPTGLDLALTCIRVQAGEYSIELLRSVDHGTSWSWAGTLLSAKDALATCNGPLPIFTGADLFFVGGQEYLVATPGGMTIGSTGYDGCEVFAVDNGTSVRRDEAGAPLVLRRMQGKDHRFAGPCTYAEGASAAGYMMTMDFADQPQSGKLLLTFASGIRAP